MTSDAAPTWAELVAAWELFRDPILCAVIGGAALGYLSVYVLLRRMVFVSATVTQSAGLGVALAFFAEIHWGLHVEPIVGAAGLSLLATLVLSLDSERLGLSREAVLGLVYAATGGAAVLIGDRIVQEAHDIQSILFGTAVLVSPFDLGVVAAVAGLSLVIHLAWWRGLVFASFDPVAATVQGLPVRLLSAVVLLTVGLVVGATARALGALPVFALATLPGFAVLALGLGLRSSFPIALALGAAAGGGGYLVAFFGQFPVGASQTAVAVVLALLAVAFRLIRRGVG